MDKKIATLFACVMLTLALGSTGAETPGKLQLVQALDPRRYSGRWYEIARFQHVFEKSLVGVTAEYSLRNDGRIDVLNSGFKKVLDGKYSSIHAVAWVPDSSKPGALKVRFFGLFASDYLVFGLDQTNYSWALVGNNSRDFLWFLSRTPTISPELMAAMKKQAESQGYDISKLYEVPQKLR
jgi:apolipoprotein D and lipocalin family protein